MKTKYFVFVFCVFSFYSTVNSQTVTENLKTYPTPNYDTGVEYFGASLSVDGEYAVVGAYKANNSKGTAFVLHYDGSSWNVIANLQSSSVSDQYYFGYAVKIQGDVITVGNYGKQAVFMFIKPDEGWSDMTETVTLTPSHTSLAKDFGSALDISGDGNTIVVAAPGSNMVYVYEKPGSGWENMTETKYLAPYGAGAKSFGKSVTVSQDGSVIAVGDIGYSSDGFCCNGSAYIYVRSNSSWATEPDPWQDGILTASDKESYKKLGASVKVTPDGTYVFSGATGYPGKVYVFKEPDAGWKDTTEVVQITPSDATGDFGASIDCSGDALVVGAPGDWSISSNSGAAYVFEKSPDEDWPALVQKAKLTSTDGMSYGYLGYSACFYGNGVLAGAPGQNSDFGSVYYYDKPETGWASATETAKIGTPAFYSDNHEHEYYGQSVAVDDDYAVIGAPGKNSDKGGAYVVHFTGDSWETVAFLRASDGKKNDNFGKYVDIHGDVIAVGTHYNTVYIFEKPDEGWLDTTETMKFSTDNEVMQGLSLSENTMVIGTYYYNHVYVFGKETGDSWTTATRKAKFTGSSSDDNSFGCSVSISDDENIIAVGARGASSYTGAAYLIIKPANGDWNSAEKIRFAPSDGVSSDFFGWDVKITDDIFLVGAYGDDDKGTNSGSVYLYEKPDGGWSNSAAVHKLNAGDGTAGYNFGQSVDCIDNVVVAGAPGSNKVYVFSKEQNDPWSDVAQSAILTSTDGDDWLGFDVSVTYTSSLNSYSIISGETQNDSRGEWSGAAYIYFIASQATNVKITENKELSVYPNPATDIIMFDNDKVINEVSIFNVAGEKLLTRSQGDVRMMNISGLKPGIYIIKVTSGNETFTGRLLKK